MNYMYNNVKECEESVLPNFSIITAFYKGQQYLPKLIEMADENYKVLENNNINSKVELIIVNDYPSEEVVLPEYDGNIQIHLVTHERNYGIHQARVTGLSHCTGEYIIFLDQDDEIENNCILKQYQAIKQADVVVGNAFIEQQDGSKKLLYKTKSSMRRATMIMPYIKAHNQITSPGHCMIKKKSIPIEWTKYIMKNNGSDDLFLWILMLAKNIKFVTCFVPVYTHRFTGSNLSSEESKMAESSLEIVDFLKEINYISPKVIRLFEKNRNLKIEMKHCDIFRKILLIVENLNIFLPRIYWRLFDFI